MNREVVVVSAVRTAVGTFGGSLKDHAPTRLGAMVVREAVARAGLGAGDVQHVVFGHVINTEPRDMYLARVAALEGGLSQDVPAMTLNRLCGSGMQAIVSASQAILLGDADAAVAGGAEVMSRGPYSMPAARWGARMGDARVVDMMTGALHDPFHDVHMGVTAENVAKKWGISREDQDALAVEPSARVARDPRGRFASQILPIELKSRKGTTTFAADEHPPMRRSRRCASSAGVREEDGTVTPGNASGINDGAAALVLMERRAAEARGLAPLARLVSYAHAGVDRLHGDRPRARFAQGARRPA